MSDRELILQTTDAIYASNTDTDCLPKALQGTSSLLGAAGAIFEVAEKATKRSNSFWCGAGAPNAARKSYIEKFEPINPRLVLFRDPLARNVTARRMFMETFGLTDAEGHLAQALSAGMTTGIYATTRRISLNTVYTHLRRIREKTQCNSVAELLLKFGELNVPLRLS
jgi:DNA-binding CsgD family transcriptional regulator